MYGQPTRYTRPARPAQLGDVFDVAGGVLKGISSIFGGGSKPKLPAVPRHWTTVTSTGVPYEQMVDSNGTIWDYWNGQVFNSLDGTDPAPRMKAAMAAAGATAANPNGTLALPGGASVPAPSSAVRSALPWVALGLVGLVVVPRLLRSRR